MNGTAIYRFLERGRAKLNPIVMATAFFRDIIRVGIAAGFVIFCLRLTGIRQANLGLWEFLTLAGGMAGLLLSWRRRLDLIDAAYWLDNHLHTREAFAAASICLDRNCSGRLDAFIIERAGNLAESNPVIQWPYRNLLKQAAIALGVQLLLIPLMLFVAPKLAWHSMNKSPAGNRIGPVIRRNAPSQNRPRISTLPPRTIATQLFPNDTRLAASLENALKTGDTQTVEQLLGKAKTGFDAVSGNNDLKIKEDAYRAARDYQRAVQERKRFTGPGLTDSDNSPAGRRSPGQASGSGERPIGADQTMHNRQPAGTNGLADHAPPSGRNPNGMKSSGSENSEGSGSPGNDPGVSLKGGSKPGKGRGSNDGHWKTIMPDGSGRPMTVQPKGSTLEFVLPGKGAKLPMAEVLPAYRQATEAALHRQGTPGEYQDYVRSYFEALSKETHSSAGDSGNGAETKGELK